MTLRPQRVRELRQAVSRSLGALGLDDDARAYDGWLDAASLAAALDGDGPLLLRGAVALPDAGVGYAAEPRGGWWLKLGDGRFTCVPIRGSDVAAPTATGVRVELTDELCCDSKKCDKHKRVAALWLSLDAAPHEIMLGEQLLEDAEPCALALAAKRLAARLGVEAELTVAASKAAEHGEAVPARELARWALRREGDVFVLRDHASHGPRDGARREWALAVVFGGAAIAAWWGTWRAWQGEAWETMAIVGAVAAVMTFFVVTMAMIARHSSRYRADSEALMMLVRDRFVVAPWHSRSGAVGIAEGGGRYGAPIPLGELDDIQVVQDGDGYALRCATAHGEIDVGVLEDQQQAQRWMTALKRWSSALAHAIVMALLVACAPAGPKPDRTTPLPPTATGTVGSTAVATTTAPTTTAPTTVGAPAPKLVLIEDDVPKALAQAKGEKKLLFVEVWAPWCHTCLSMKSFVLPDPAIVALQDKVVFAAIDSDKDQNAAFMARYEVNAWPTLYMLDTAGEVLSLWQGAASVEELRTFIDDALALVEAKLDSQGAASALLAAKRAHAGGDYKSAALHYDAALSRAGDDWPRRSEARFGALYSQYKQMEWLACAERGLKDVASITGAAVPADYSWVLLFCADKIKKKRPGLAKRVRKAAIARLAAHTTSPPAAASVDDKSDALAIYSGALTSVGDKRGAEAAIIKQIGLLEAAAEAAPGPKERSTFDYARMGAYLKLGRSKAAIKMFMRRIEQMPDNYEPHARLGQTYFAVRDWKRALASIDKAIALAYGPRRLRYFSMKAQAHEKLGDKAAARAAWNSLIEAYDKLPKSTRDNPRWVELVADARKAAKR